MDYRNTRLCRRLSLLMPIVWIAATDGQATAQEVRIVKQKENVVASELLGKWIFDESISNRLGGKSGHFGTGPLAFRQSAESAKRIVDRLQHLIDNHPEPEQREDVDFYASLKTVYLAGELEVRDRKWDFALIAVFGCPRLVFYDSEDDDFESTNLMLARDHKGNGDLLFIGGDWNNQSFGGFQRASEKKPHPPMPN
jgi:hypothetical protein